jgi:transcription antitermination factor NusA-like protein
VKTPLCNICIKSGILCPRCQEKVTSGEITETDIQVARVLLSLEDKHTSLQKIDFYKAYEADNVLALVVGPGNLKQFQSEGGTIIRDIAEKTGKRIRIFENRGDSRAFLEELFAPVTITTINKIFLPDGSQETRVVLPGHSRKLPLRSEGVKELAKEIRGITLRIAFERQLERDYA